MARGYPDFFGYSTFPYFGPVQVQNRLTGVVGAGGRELIYEVTTKAIIRGGYLHIVGQPTPTLGILDFYVDVTAAWYTISLGAMKTAHLEGNEWFFRLIEYSPVDELYTIAFNGDTTVGTVFRLYYENGGAAAVNLSGYLWYTQVT